MRYIVREMVKWWHGHKVLISWIQVPQSLSSACSLFYTSYWSHILCAEVTENIKDWQATSAYSTFYPLEWVPQISAEHAKELKFIVDNCLFMTYPWKVFTEKVMVVFGLGEH